MSTIRPTVIRGFIYPIRIGVSICVYTKNVAVNRDWRCGETLSVVENACRALRIAQAHTASYLDYEYLKIYWVLCFRYCGGTGDSTKPQKGEFYFSTGRGQGKEEEEVPKHSGKLWKVRMVRKLSVSSLSGQPDLVIQFYFAEEPPLCLVCQIRSVASCGRLGVFRAPVAALQNANAVGHQQNGRNPLSREG